MTAVTLVPVRFILPTDVYHYSVDNRPLGDLNTNVLAIATALNSLVGYSNLPAAVTVPASGVAYQNTATYPVDLLISGGTVSAITFSRDGVTYYATGMTSGVLNLSPNDYVKITYTVVPTVIGVPR